MNIYKGVGLFASGVLFGSAGFKLLSSKDAKKAYTHATAAALRVKESVMETVTSVQEMPLISWPPPRKSMSSVRRRRRLPA